MTQHRNSQTSARRHQGLRERRLLLEALEQRQLLTRVPGVLDLTLQPPPGAAVMLNDDFLVDDGDDGYAETGADWLDGGLVGSVNGDYRYHRPGDAASTASWEFNNLAAGSYEVLTTWVPFDNRAGDALFTLSDGTAAEGQKAVNQQRTPDDAVIDGWPWERLGTIHIESQTLVVELKSSTDGVVIADAVRVAPVAGAEIAVLEGSREVADGETVDFGTVLPGETVEKTLIVENRGGEELALMPIDSGMLPAGFELTDNIADDLLAPGETTSFTVRFLAEGNGRSEGLISLENGDSDENPYRIFLEGEASKTLLIDDGTIGYGETGAQWFDGALPGAHQGDYRYHRAGSGDDAAHWEFFQLPAGSYRVSATWTAFSNRTSTATFSIFDGQTLRTTSEKNQQLPPSTFESDDQAWEELAVVRVESGSLRVRLGVSKDGVVIADAIRLDPVSGPNIFVFDGGNEIPDAGTLDFGSVPPSAPVTKVITITNRGVDTLQLVPITDARVPFPFDIVANIRDTSLGPNESTTFTVQVLSDVEGEFSGSLTIENNDADEDPYDIHMIVSVGPIVVDDGESGYRETGTGWLDGGLAGAFGSDYRYHRPGSGKIAAVWTFAGLPAGHYLVSTTWVAFENRASDALYTVTAGTVTDGSVGVNQQSAPDSFAIDGQLWKDLGVFVVDGGSLTVELSDDADGIVIADAVRIARIRGSEMVVRDEAQNLKRGATVDFGATLPGTPSSKVLTVHNAGVEDLALVQIQQSDLPAGYSLVSGFDDLSLAAGESTSFELRLSSEATGTFSGFLSIVSDDVDTSPFALLVTGSVGSVLIDDGDPGYGEAGIEWSSGDTGGAFQGDFRFQSPGDGTSSASWTLEDVPGGSYEVYATWTPFGDRSSSAPFSVFDGGTLERAVLLNQQKAPVGRIRLGRSWEPLGTFEIGNGALTVQLSRTEDGVVIADGVLIRRAPSPTSVDVRFSGQIVADAGATPVFPLGTPFSGSFSYDTSAPPANSGSITANYGTALTDFEFQISGNVYSAQRVGPLGVANDFRPRLGVTVDEFRVFSTPQGPPVGQFDNVAFANILLSDSDATVFPSIAIPRDFDLGEFEIREFRMAWDSSATGAQSIVSGEIENFSFGPFPPSSRLWAGAVDQVFEGVGSEQQ